MEAMNSMDLIYKKASKSLGLLSTPIETGLELDSMVRLMDGKLAFRSSSGRCTIDPHVCRETIEQVVCLLERLTSDPWWTRAWVFQEEYVAGIRMDLLIPLSFRGRGPSKYERIPGELCISATFFRQEATILLLAYQQRSYRQHDASIRRMLELIGKYNVLLLGGGGGCVPMSARIASDITKRRLENPWDRIAITANACDYEIRLDHDTLAKRGLSISVSLLAQYLLNGEILVTRRRGEKDPGDTLDVRVTRWMRDTALQGGSLPVESKQLSFLKGCRLPNVRFAVDGVQTRGLIWRLQRRNLIRTDRLRCRQMTAARTEQLCQEPWRAQELDELICRLRGHHAQLADNLQDYIHKRRQGVGSPADDYLDAMAWEVVQAVNQGRDIRIGYTRERKCAGIFVPRTRNSARDMWVFTAWRSRKFAANNLDRFVSLRVTIQRDGTLSAQGWINGLVFFRSGNVQDVTFAWPESWKA